MPNVEMKQEKEDLSGLDISGTANSKNFYEQLKHIPEIRSALVWIKEDPDRFTQIAKQYIDLVDKLSGYSSVEAELIERTRHKMEEDNVDSTSASSVNTANFVRGLNPEKSTQLKATVRDAFDPESESYSQTLEDLAVKMYNAHELTQKKAEKPKDGDPIWDNVIWTHTQLRNDVDPETASHVFLAHFLAQYMIKKFPEDMAEKDDFLEYLTDTILLEESRKPGSTELLNIWITPKNEGGLGWLSSKQLEAYKSVTNDI